MVFLPDRLPGGLQLIHVLSELALNVAKSIACAVS